MNSKFLNITAAIVFTLTLFACSSDDSDTNDSDDNMTAETPKEEPKEEPVPVVNKIPGDFAITIEKIAEATEEEAPTKTPIIKDDRLVAAKLVPAQIKSTKNSYKITWTESVDPDGDAVTYKVNWIGVKVISESTTNRAYTISSAEITKQGVSGTQTITITAKDGKGGEKSMTATFETPTKVSIAKF